MQTRREIRDSFAQGFKDFPNRIANESNIRIRIYNEASNTPTAFLNGDVTSTRTDASGRVVNANNREGLVWMKIQGKWPIVNHQNSPIE